MVQCCSTRQTYTAAKSQENMCRSRCLWTQDESVSEQPVPLSCTKRCFWKAISRENQTPLTWITRDIRKDKRRAQHKGTSALLPALATHSGARYSHCYQQKLKLLMYIQYHLPHRDSCQNVQVCTVNIMSAPQPPFQPPSSIIIWFYGYRASKLIFRVCWRLCL